MGWDFAWGVVNGSPKTFNKVCPLSGVLWRNMYMYTVRYLVGGGSCLDSARRSCHDTPSVVIASTSNTHADMEREKNKMDPSIWGWMEEEKKS